MSALDALLDSPFAYHLGWTLVHFLWQGVLVAAVYACLRSYMAEASPQARYALSLATLAVLAALPVVTFIYLMGTPVAVHTITGYAAGSHELPVAQQADFMDSLRSLLRPMVPWTVPAWSVGVALLGFKSLAGWHRARMLTRQASHVAPDAWQETVTRLASQVGVRVRVRLMVTARVAVPCVIGWLKPVILLPPAALTGLTTLQLEMVLAHELSHIRRHDYLVNLLQVAVETLLFYHPAVRWISRDARRERELCCDDSAVHACGDALHYAHALTDLAALRSGELSPALGITGGDLTLRVERLISPHHAASAPRLASVMLTSALCLCGFLALASTRHLPLPLNQGISLPVPQLVQTAARAVEELAAHQPLVPTRIEALMPRQGAARRLRANGGVAVAALQEVAAPVAPAPALKTVAPVDIGGASLASLLSGTDSIRSQTFDISKHSAAPVKVIDMNHVDAAPAPKGEHEYCEPMTGSRVCK
jgi:beta-lactamase regulating signal transducer with metallopeptidase domain